MKLNIRGKRYVVVFCFANGAEQVIKEFDDTHSGLEYAANNGYVVVWRNTKYVPL